MEKRTKISNFEHIFSSCPFASTRCIFFLHISLKLSLSLSLSLSCFVIVTCNILLLIHIYTSLCIFIWFRETFNIPFGSATLTVDCIKNWVKLFDVVGAITTTMKEEENKMWKFVLWWASFAFAEKMMKARGDVGASATWQVNNIATFTYCEEKRSELTYKSSDSLLICFISRLHAILFVLKWTFSFFHEALICFLFHGTTTPFLWLFLISFFIFRKNIVLVIFFGVFVTRIACYFNFCSSPRFASSFAMPCKFCIQIKDWLKFGLWKMFTRIMQSIHKIRKMQYFLSFSLFICAANARWVVWRSRFVSWLRPIHDFNRVFCFIRFFVL